MVKLSLDKLYVRWLAQVFKPLDLLYICFTQSGKKNVLQNIQHVKGLQDTVDV